MITWKQLEAYIGRMTEHQKNKNVVIHLNSKDEFINVDEARNVELAVDHAELVDSNEDDRLEDGYPILVVID